MSSQATRQIKTIVGDNIRAARDDLGLTQQALAQAVGALSGAAAVSRWERGVVLPSAGSLTQLAAVLGQDIHWFYTDHEKEAA